MKLIVATRNKHKLREICGLLGEVADRFDILASGDLPGLPEIIEDGTTLQDNAIKKARETASATVRQFQENSFIILADDSGLEVDALDGAPGVWSARFAQFDGVQPAPDFVVGHVTSRGETPPPSQVTRPTIKSVSYHDNNVKLLKLLKNTPDEKRTARFRCVVAIVESTGDCHIVKGTCDGVIAHAERGTHGFGYDPLFIPRGYDKTLAELGESIKNRISHRARALDKAREILRNL